MTCGGHYCSLHILAAADTRLIMSYQILGYFSCIGQNLACLCQHISHYVGLVSVECYID